MTPQTVTRTSPAFPMLICINLVRAPSRRARMTEQAERLGVTVQFVDAVDGADPTFDASAGGYDPQRRSRIGPPLLKTEIACVTSHLLALQAFIASSAEHAVILEDDAILAENFVDVIDDLVAVYAPGCFVRLHRPKKRIFALPVGTLPCGAKLMLPKRTTMEAIATLYDRAAAAATIDAFSVYFDAFDTHRGRTWNIGLIALEVWPPCAGNDDGDSSTIDNGAEIRPNGRAFSRRRPLQWPGFWLQRASDGVMEPIWLGIGWWRMRRHARRVMQEAEKTAPLKTKSSSAVPSRS